MMRLLLCCLSVLYQVLVVAQNSTTVDSASFLQQPTREYSNGAKDVRAGSYVWALEREKVVLRRGVVVR